MLKLFLWLIEKANLKQETSMNKSLLMGRNAKDKREKTTIKEVGKKSFHLALIVKNNEQYKLLLVQIWGQM